MNSRADITALVELKGVSKRFVKSLDLAARIGNKFGAGLKEEVVHAVDNVDLSWRPAKWSDSSASPDAASRRSDA